MKSVVVFLATLVLCCLVVLLRSAFAGNVTLCCGGPWDGCPSTGATCYSATGNCPSGAPYLALQDTMLSVYSCVPMGPGCEMNVNRWWCSKNGYDNEVNGLCGNKVCQFYEYVDQCSAPACPN
jgi:hypothetical protein